MKASQSIHQFLADVMPLQKSSGGLNWCPSIHIPSTTEKISISLRPGLGLRSPIVERKNNNIPLRRTKENLCYEQPQYTQLPLNCTFLGPSVSSRVVTLQKQHYSQKFVTNVTPKNLLVQIKIIYLLIRLFLGLFMNVHVPFQVDGIDKLLGTQVTGNH